MKQKTIVLLIAGFEFVSMSACLALLATPRPGPRPSTNGGRSGFASPSIGPERTIVGRLVDIEKTHSMNSGGGSQIEYEDRGKKKAWFVLDRGSWGYIRLHECLNASPTGLMEMWVVSVEFQDLSYPGEVHPVKTDLPVFRILSVKPMDRSCRSSPWNTTYKGPSGEFPPYDGKPPEPFT